MSDYEPIIGLEIHVELATQSKMFCGCKNDPFFASDPNIYTCPVCLGMPGGLPVPNKKAVEWCMILGLALNSTVSAESKFDRKNYFYPDLPKGYQITQYDKPLCINGYMSINGRKIRIARVHIEEDTGKLIHATVEGKRVSLVDFNRSGVPLVEIVTEPDFRTVEEVDQFLKKLQQIIRYLGISGADMEKGSMRLEPSISLRLVGSAKLPDYRVEIKNINSFRFVRKALEYEIDRQTDMLQNRVQPLQQTRGFVEPKGTTVAQREKEEAHDYRYFPEPDIPPMQWEPSFIKKLTAQLPELPDTKRERFVTNYELNAYDANILTETPTVANYFEECVRVSERIGEAKHLSPKKIANWIINKRPDIDVILPAKLIEDIWVQVAVVEVPQEDIETAIDEVLHHQIKAVADYQKGKEQALMFLLGQVIKELNGKGDKKIITEKLKEKLG